jgi:hypothetical protein
VIDHGFQFAHARGNIGSGFRLGILDVPPFDRHERKMSIPARRAAPGAEIVWGDARDPASLWGLVTAGCGAVALPFTLPHSHPIWDQALTTARVNGCVLFAATGNGVAETMYPATHGSVFSCGAVAATDGHWLTPESSASGKRNIGVLSSDYGSSGASVMAAAMYLLWLGHGQFTHSKADQRHQGCWDWIVRTGTPLPGGGYAPNCSTL